MFAMQTPDFAILKYLIQMQSIFKCLWSVHHAAVLTRYMYMKIDGFISLFDSLPPCNRYEFWARLGELMSASHLLNTLWPSDATWRQEPMSTLVQIMVCCLMTPSHYLHQFWLLISEVLWHSHAITASAQGALLFNAFEIIHLKLLPHLPGANELTH